VFSLVINKETCENAFHFNKVKYRYGGVSYLENIDSAYLPISVGLCYITVK
jgi:hypothetical protein